MRWLTVSGPVTDAGAVSGRPWPAVATSARGTSCGIRRASSAGVTTSSGSASAIIAASRSSGLTGSRATIAAPVLRIAREPRTYSALRG